ncbi:MAG: DUF2249 domain-containing protein [Dehalococcoidia bacterium]
MTIAPETKISDLLKEYPQLLDVLADYSPAFGKLRNPLLRRTFGRLTTLAQAAAIGGVDLTELLRTLRQAAGEPELAPATEAETLAALPPSAATPEPPAWLDEARVTATFDARPLQARGEEPLAPILRMTAEVEEGDILRLWNTFEPFPLYEVLGRKGFVPWARPTAEGDWEVYFYKKAPGEEFATPEAPAVAEGPAPTVATLTIDVSQLVPPEPMMRVLEALAQLKPGDTLLVHHVREPMYLYPKLEELGHSHQTWKLGPDRVDILIKVGGK